MKHWYRTVVLLGIFSLILSAAPTVSEQVQKWRQGRRITVALHTGDKVVGRLGPLQAGGFSIVLENRNHSERQFRFDEVQTVTTKMTTATKWEIGAIIYVPFLIGSLILGK
jgi:hypothetical protein